MTFDIDSFVKIKVEMKIRYERHADLCDVKHQSLSVVWKHS